jgi:hypothetical protein
VAESLAQLGVYGWFLLHDVHWPGRPLARLEHVLVGPGGVVVVNAKNWSGHVDVVDGALLQASRNCKVPQVRASKSGGLTASRPP